MNKNMLFFVWLISPLLSYAQDFSVNYQSDQWENPVGFYGVEESSSSTEKVLDSIVTTRFDFGNEYLFQKWGWEHDDLARDIEFFVFRWDDTNNTLFQSNQRDFTFFPNKNITINQRANDALTPLSLSYRNTDWLDINGDNTESYYENWDEELEMWVPGSKYINTLQSDTLVVRNQYSWDEDLQEYQLNGKSETRTYDLFRSTYRFNVDTDGNFVPNYILEFTDNPTTESLELYEQIRYFPDIDEWKVVTQDRWVYDFSNLTGYRTEAADWHSLSNGEFIVHDSTTFVMDEDYNRTLGKGFVPFSNNLDVFVHFYNYEYDFSSNEFLKVQYTDRKVDNIFEPYEVIKNYYSEIEVSTTTPTPSIQKDLEIQFPNPAQHYDQLVISKLPEGISSVELWVIDQSGRLLHQRDVNVGESYGMQDLGIGGSGVYFVTLFVERGQRSWKVVGM